MFPCAFQSRLLSSFSVCDSPAEAGRTASVSAAGVRLSVQTCACDSRSRGGMFGRRDLDSLGTTAVASVGVCSSQKHHPRGFGPFTHTRGVTPVLTQYANEARETSTQHSGRPNAPSLIEGSPPSRASPMGNTACRQPALSAVSATELRDGRLCPLG